MVARLPVPRAGRLEATVPGTNRAFAIHVPRSGRLAEISQPAGFGESVLQIPGTTSLWTVGGYEVRTGSVAGIWLHGKG